MKSIFLIIGITFVFTSCEKKINFKLNNAGPVLVVDAQIENGQAPTVILTTSLNYFSSISPQILASSFVHNAVVVMSNGTLTHQFKEYAVPLGGGYTGYFYSLDTTNLSTVFFGQFNTAYSLDIKTAGNEFQATTTIPALTKYPDSIWFNLAPSNPDTNKRILIARITDPPGLGNYIRYFTKINNGNLLPGANSVYDDAVIDGTTYTLQVDPGIDRNFPLAPSDNYFRRGDTVTLKICDIDQATYTFWNTWEFAQESNGNPFAQPTKVIGNISNSALGAFYGYAAWYKTLIAR